MKPIIHQRKNGQWYFHRLRFMRFLQKTCDVDNMTEAELYHELSLEIKKYKKKVPNLHKIILLHSNVGSFEPINTLTSIFYMLYKVGEENNIEITVEQPHQLLAHLIMCSQMTPIYDIPKIQFFLEKYPHQAMEKTIKHLSVSLSTNYICDVSDSNVLEVIPLLPKEDKILDYWLKHILLNDVNLQVKVCETQPLFCGPLNYVPNYLYKNLMFFTDNEFVHQTMITSDIVRAFYHHFKKENETLSTFHLRITQRLQEMEDRWVYKKLPNHQHLITDDIEKTHSFYSF